MQDLIWKMKTQLCHLIWLGIQLLGIHLVSFGRTGKEVHTVKE